METFFILLIAVGFLSSCAGVAAAAYALGVKNGKQEQARTDAKAIADGLIEEETYSVWWRKDPEQRMPSRTTVYSIDDAGTLSKALKEIHGWQAWWTLNERKR